MVTKKIPQKSYHLVGIIHSFSMDPSTTASSDDTLSDFSRRKQHPDYSNVNFQEIRKVMSPKDSKKRPPIPNFENSSTSNDEKKENKQEVEENLPKKSSILRKRSSSGSKKPMGISNASNIQRAATQMNRREHPLKLDRSRRSTAPVRTSIKRMQPNSCSSGLTLSKMSKSVHRRRSSSRRSISNTSTDSTCSQDDINSNSQIDLKNIERRRRRLKKKENNESMTNVYNGSNTSVVSPNAQTSISPVLSITANSTNNKSIEITSDLPLTSDHSSPELQRAIPAFISSVVETTPKSTMVSLITKKKATPPPPPLSVDVNISHNPQYSNHNHEQPLPLITPSPDSGCSLASSKQLHSDHSKSENDHHVFVKPELPKRFIRPSKVDIKPTGTSIYLPTESSRAKMKNPVIKSPLPHTPTRRSSSVASPRPTSKSPSRRPRPQNIPASPSDSTTTFDFNVNDDFDGTSKQKILSATTNYDCNVRDFGRPSIAQIQGTGVVGRRIQQFKKLSNNSSRPTYGMSGNESSFGKPSGKPASHGLSWKPNSINGAIAEHPIRLPRFAAAKAAEQKTPIRKTIVKKKEELTRRQALMSAMSKLSLRSPVKNLKGSTPKKTFN
jgi:hypothetical protein